ncbi:MAG: hypothetical protein IMF09_03940 [Proteobacteria bacterium]|nr:hypothetical protein [Pseudomonadota bacterium]
MFKYKALLPLLLLLAVPLVSAQQCPNTVNISVRLNTQNSPTMPELSNQSQNRVCVKSGGSVIFVRNGQGTQNGFGIFLKDGSWSSNSTNNRLEFIAPDVDVETEKAYGITMPDAGAELDPIIIIIPRLDE